MCLEHVFEVDNVGSERMFSGRLFQVTAPATYKMPDCRVVALFWVRPNHSEQQNGEQKDWEQSKLECKVR